MDLASPSSPIRFGRKIYRDRTLNFIITYFKTFSTMRIKPTALYIKSLSLIRQALSIESRFYLKIFFKYLH